MPTNPHRWPKARAFGLVWRPRAVPRTHGTRAAWGLRPAGHYEPPARSSLTTGLAGESAAPRRIDAGRRAERRPKVTGCADRRAVSSPCSGRKSEEASGAKTRRENEKG